MESKSATTQRNCTPELSKVVSVLRGRDLEQRERKLIEAQKELLQDRQTLETHIASTEGDNQQNVTYLSTQLATSMEKTTEYQSRIDSLHLQIEQLRTNSEKEKHAEVAQLQKRLVDMEELHTNSQVENIAEVAHVRKRLATAKNTSTQKQQEHEQLYSEIQHDVDMYTTNMRMQLEDVKSQLKRTEIQVSDLTSKLGGTETQMSDLTAQLADKHNQLIELSQKLAASEAGHKTSMKQGAANTAKCLEDHQKFAVDQKTKLGDVCKQLDASKNEMEKQKYEWASETTKTTNAIKRQANEYKQNLYDEKLRTDSIIAENQLDLDHARTESDRLANIIDDYKTNSNESVHTGDSIESLRSMIMASLPNDLVLHGVGTYDDIVDKVMLNMGSCK